MVHTQILGMYAQVSPTELLSFDIVLENNALMKFNIAVLYSMVFSESK